MIRHLSIKNFKSIKDLQLDCKRINLFIGEPNVGKSNILEAFALPAFQGTLSFYGLLRYNDLSNLFFENDPSNIVDVRLDEVISSLSYEKGKVYLKYHKSEEWNRSFVGTFSNFPDSNQGAQWDFGIRPYFFRSLTNFPKQEYEALTYPHGDNLFSMLQTRKELRGLVSSIIQDRGFKLLLRQEKFEIEISKEEDSILVSYPYHMISDTLQRLIFYLSAIETNKTGSALIFEEPESNVFPYYTKFLAERIALDHEKQYFITTHNPYFLQALIEKTPLDDLAVSLVQMEKYKTVVHTLSEKGVEEILNLTGDVFLNFDRLLEV